MQRSTEVRSDRHSEQNLGSGQGRSEKTETEEERRRRIKGKGVVTEDAVSPRAVIMPPKDGPLVIRDQETRETNHNLLEQNLSMGGHKEKPTETIPHSEATKAK